MLMHQRLSEIERIINYLRKSRKDEELERRTGEDTLALHTKIMDDVLTPLGIPYDTIKEVASGETIEGRPEFVKVLKWLEEGRYQAIAVKEISRLGRGDLKDIGTVLEIIKDMETLILTPERVYDIANSHEDEQFVQLQMVVSNIELQNIVRRLVQARKERAREGRWMATVPFGYDRDKNSKRLVANEDEAEIVKLIFRWYVYEGCGHRVIAHRLTSMKVPAPRNGNQKKIMSDTDWEETTVARILTNNVYIGIAKFGTTKWKGRQKKSVPLDEKYHIIYENAHPAIVTPQEYEMAQEIRKERNGFPKNQYNNPDYEPYELTSLIRCSECGLQIRVAKYIKEYKNGTSAEIRSLRCKRGCNYIAYETVLGYVENLLKTIGAFERDKLEERFAKFQVVKDVTEKELKLTRQFTEQNYDERISQLKRELVNHARRIDIIGEEVYFQLKAQVEAEINALEELKKTTEQASAGVSDDKERTNKIVDLANLYSQCKTRTQKHQILSAIFDHIVLKVVQRGSKRHPAKCELTPYIKYHVEVPKL